MSVVLLLIAFFYFSVYRHILSNNMTTTSVTSICRWPHFDTVEALDLQLRMMLERLHTQRIIFHTTQHEIDTVINVLQTGTFLEVDVGGKLHRVHRSCLGASDSGNMLASIADFPDMGGGREEYVFVDRDPVLFPLVLHALRGSRCDRALRVLYGNEAHRAAMYREARYFSVDTLLHATTLPAFRVDIIGVKRTKGGRRVKPALYLHQYRPDASEDAHIATIHPDDRVGRILPKDCCAASAGGVCFITTNKGSVWRVAADMQPPVYCFGLPQYRRFGFRGSAFNAQRREYVLLGTPKKNTESWWCAYNESRGRWDTPWKLLPHLHFSGLYGCCTCYAYDRIFIVGGVTESSPPITTAAAKELVYPFVVWEDVPSLPSVVGLYNATVVAWRGEFMVIGGSYRREYEDAGHVGFEEVLLNTVWAYRPDTRLWRRLPDMRYARARCITYVWGPSLVVLGGEGPWGNRVERFDGQRWSTMPKMLLSPGFMGIAAIPTDTPFW